MDTQAARVLRSEGRLAQLVVLGQGGKPTEIHEITDLVEQGADHPAAGASDVGQRAVNATVDLTMLVGLTPASARPSVTRTPGQLWGRSIADPSGALSGADMLRLLADRTYHLGMQQTAQGHYARAPGVVARTVNARVAIDGCAVPAGLRKDAPCDSEERP